MNLAIRDATVSEWVTFPDGYLPPELFIEIDFWVHLTPSDLHRPWRRPHHGIIEVPQNLSTRPRILYTDASTYRLGGVIHVGGKRIVVSFGLTEAEYDQPIHYKEMLIILRLLEAGKRYLCAQRLKLFCDNQVCCYAWQGDGCRDVELTRLMKKIYLQLQELQSSLQLEWCSTTEQEADEPSRVFSVQGESILRPRLQAVFRESLHINLDCFAERCNAVCGRYISRYPETNSIHCDALSYCPQVGDVLYLYPPRSLVETALQVLVKPSVKCCMVYSVYGNYESHFSVVTKLFEHCVVIGDKVSPSCLTPSTKKKQVHAERRGYRLYTSPAVTYALLRGFSSVEVTEFRHRVYQTGGVSGSRVGESVKL